MNAAVLLAILQGLPAAIDTGLRIIKAMKKDPETPDAVKTELDKIEAGINAAIERVKTAPVPPEGSGA